MKYLKLALMRLAHMFDWLKRLLRGPEPWQTDMTPVLPGLYLGGFFQHWPTSICAVLNLAEENRYQAPLDRFLLDAGRPDLVPAQNPAEIQWLVDWVIGALRQGKTVLVCCDAGDNRSAMIVIAVVMVFCPTTYAEALALVRSKRPSVGPHDFQQQALRDYENSLK